MAWYILRPWGDDAFEGEVAALLDLVENEIQPQLERVPGVASVGTFGGQQHEMQVIVDPAELAARQVTLNQLAAALDLENRNFSGGDFAEGKRRYIVRTMGEYNSPEDIGNVVIAIRNGVPIYVKNVAEVKLGLRKARAEVYNKGIKVLAVNMVREPGANSLWVMEGVTGAVGALNEGLLADRGLRLVHSFDETTYIKSSISLVRQSLIIGGVLAIVVLLLFLRSRASTLVVAVAIPISVIGTFLILWLLGRTLNVISLAGMAFAVGMVVDNSIVVLENIYRHRQMGKRRFDAAYEGTKEVWGAVLASTLTTIAVFLPIIFVQEEAGTALSRHRSGHQRCGRPQSRGRDHRDSCDVVAHSRCGRLAGESAGGGRGRGVGRSEDRLPRPLGFRRPRRRCEGLGRQARRVGLSTTAATPRHRHRLHRGRDRAQPASRTQGRVPAAGEYQFRLRIPGTPSGLQPGRGQFLPRHLRGGAGRALGDTSGGGRGSGGRRSVGLLVRRAHQQRLHGGLGQRRAAGGRADPRDQRSQRQAAGVFGFTSQWSIFARGTG